MWVSLIPQEACREHLTPMFVCSAHQVQGCVCQVSVDSNSPPALLYSCTPALHLLGSPGQCNLPNKWKDQYQPTPTEWCSYWIVVGTKPAKHLPLLSLALRVVLFPVSFSLCASFFLFVPWCLFLKAKDKMLENAQLSLNFPHRPPTGDAAGGQFMEVFQHYGAL